jgi:hypothetical protein
MPAEAMSESYRPLLDALFVAFEGSAAGRPAVPPGRRGEVVALLTRLMTDADLYDSYVATLRAERARRGAEMKLLTLESPDIPDERIIAEGFSGLGDEVLADLALSPAALEALTVALYHDPQSPAPGPWFFATETLGATARSLIASTTRLPAPTTSPPRYRGVRRGWLAAGLAVAASFLLGIFLGPLVTDRVKRPEFALAQVEARGDAARGIEDVQLLVTNDGSARAFVTVVGLSPGNRRPVVFYRSGDTFVTVPPRDTVAVKSLPRDEFAEVTTVIVFLTAVPAGEVVRVSLPAAAAPEKAAELAEQLRSSLAANNVRAETRVVPIPTTKR